MLSVHIPLLSFVFVAGAVESIGSSDLIVQVVCAIASAMAIFFAIMDATERRERKPPRAAVRRVLRRRTPTR